MGLSGKFRVYLAGNGKRLTREREAILREVLSLCEPFDTEQIVERVSKWAGGVGHATVYRTLLDMTSAGALRKLDGTRFQRSAYD